LPRGVPDDRRPFNPKPAWRLASPDRLLAWPAGANNLKPGREEAMSRAWSRAPSGNGATGANAARLLLLHSLLSSMLPMARTRNALIPALDLDLSLQRALTRLRLAGSSGTDKR